ncbi:MAG: sugar ABC transporter permease [Firmicutes bacterium]|jgi:multiple sugar transport system permease protein|nr:sugar ABC transporter permease [Bacillota bacterium]MDH7494700.1 sugar ABC transporter permease [Bacillota bacterium]
MDRATRNRGWERNERRPRVFQFSESNPLSPYLFLIPHAALFLLFTVYPIGFGVYVSLHRWDVLASTQPFVGLEFYRRLLDPNTVQFQFFWKTLLNTLLFVAVSVPLLVGGALSLALLVNRPISGRGFFRAVFFAPNIFAVSVVGLVWRWVLDNQAGLVNIVLDEYLGVRPINFITEQPWAWLSIILATLWWTVGFNMVIYLAALQGIPKTYYEAAELDGASTWAKFSHITWPLLSPTTVFVVITTVIASFQLFGQSLIITGGGPSRSTQSVIMYITEEGFSNFQFSSAAAMAMVLGLIMMLFTVVQFRALARDIGMGAKGDAR